MSINLPQLINTDFKPVAFIRTGKLPCESTFIFPFTYVYPFRGKYSINILLFPFIRNSCLWQRKRNNLTNKYNKKLLSLPSKINPNPDLPAAFIPFFRRIFLMAYAMKIHLKKNAAAKGLELKERFQQQELQTASTLLRAALSRPTTQGGPSTARNSTAVVAVHPPLSAWATW